VDMFRALRAISEHTHELVSELRHVKLAILEATVAAEGAASLEQRLEELERSRNIWEGHMEGELAKAKGKLQAANNAEGRAKTQVKAFERLLDESGFEGPPEDDEDEWPDQLPPGNGERGYPEPVHDVRMGVEETPKQRALRAKFS